MSSPEEDSRADNVDEPLPDDVSQLPGRFGEELGLEPVPDDSQLPGRFVEEVDLEHVPVNYSQVPCRFGEEPDLESGVEEIPDSDDELTIFSAHLPNRGVCLDSFSSSIQQYAEQSFSEVTPLKALTVEDVEGSIKEDHQRTFTELTPLVSPLQGDASVFQPSERNQSVEEVGEGTDDIHIKRYNY